MRKVLWCCTTVVVTAVCLAHGASTYAVRHPQSIAARFVVSGSTFFDDNPLYRAGTATVAGAAVALGSGSATLDPTAECCLPKSTCCCSRDESSEALPEGQATQQLAEARLPGLIFVTEEVQNASVNDIDPKNLVPPSSHPLITLRELEECEPGCLTMPLCADDPKPGPAVMPYLCDESECQGFFGFWDRLFQSVKGARAFECLEECEAFPFVGPPECKEDPAYNLQYPGCPFSGTTPSSSKTFHPTQKILKNPKVDEECEEPAGPKVLPLKTKTKIDLEDLLPARPTIDTTEYRPSDASPNESRGQQGPF